MLYELSKFTLILSAGLFITLAILEYLHKGFVSYFLDIRIIFGIILGNLAIQILLIKKEKAAKVSS